MVQSQIIGNLEKKYNFFFNQEIKNSNPISFFEILNKTPYPIKYKQGNNLIKQI